MGNEEEQTRREAREAREARLAAQKAAQEHARAEERRLCAAVDKMLGDEDGRRVFKYLHGLCGWAQADIPQDAMKNINNGALIYNAARRLIYAKLRSKASRSLLTPVEEMAESAESVVDTAPTEETA